MEAPKVLSLNWTVQSKDASWGCFIGTSTDCNMMLIGRDVYMKDRWSFPLFRKKNGVKDMESLYGETARGGMELAVAVVLRLMCVFLKCDSLITG